MFDVRRVAKVPKIIGSSIADHRVLTRTRLLSAFGELVRESGFEKVSLAQVAQRAGVGRTALYNHFDGKDDLLLGYIMDRTVRYLDHMELSLRESGGDPVAQLRVYVHNMVELGHSNQLSFAAGSRALLSPDVIRRIREHASTVEALLRRILDDGVAAGVLPEQDLDIVVSLINSCVTTRSLPTDPRERERALAAIEDFVLRAVGAPLADIGGVAHAATA